MQHDQVDAAASRWRARGLIRFVHERDAIGAGVMDAIDVFVRAAP